MSDEKKPPVSWITPPSGAPEYYANMLRLLWTLDDVRFKIGQLVDNPDTQSDEKVIARTSAAITLSWRNAKLLRNDLIDLINSYEKVNGEISTSIVLAPNKEEAGEA